MNDSPFSRLWRAYPSLLRIGLAEAVAYRAEFFVWLLATTMPLVMLAIMTAMAREAPVGRFDQRSFIAYYLVTLVVRNMSGAWVAWEMNQEIKQGTLALRLLKPIHPIAAYTAQSLAALPLRAAMALPLTLGLLFAFARQDLSREPLNIVIFVVAIFGAWLLNFAVSAIVGTLGLYLESALQVWELWLGCFMLLSGYLVPLSLFPHWLERTARILPFAYLQAFPVETLLGMRDRTQILEGLAMQLGWAAVAWTALLILWRRGLKRFAAYGG
jgi:ABC-2 type transport system permease protein